MPNRSCIFGVFIMTVVIFSLHHYLLGLRLYKPTKNKAVPKSILKNCLFLTMNASDAPRKITADLTCQPFLSETFNDEQFALVAPAAKENLFHPENQMYASDLTNNNSVSIYFNHVRLWKQVARWDTIVLLLEDDAEFNEDAIKIIDEALVMMKKEKNFVLKLINIGHITNPLSIGMGIQQFALRWWQPWYDVQGYTISRCTCRPSIRTACAAGYLMDGEAARSFLQHSFPISKHVDAFMHEQGCVSRTINFSAIDPPLISFSNRPTLHKHSVNFLKHISLHINEIMKNVAEEDCSNKTITAKQTSINVQ